MWVKLLSLSGTVAAYLVASLIARRSRHFLVNPFIIGTTLTVAGLVWSGLPYAQYRAGAAPLAFLLGPATVALGVPLSKSFPLLRRHLHTIVVGGVAGAVVGVVAVTTAGLTLGMGRLMLLSLIPKSVTTPVAVAITQVLGGDGNLTAAMTTLTGFSGVMFARPLMDALGLRSPVARGLALGVSIHGIGTVAALEESELTAAVAGLGMAIGAVATAVVAPVAAWFVGR